MTVDLQAFKKPSSGGCHRWKSGRLGPDGPDGIVLLSSIVTIVIEALLISCFAFLARLLCSAAFVENGGRVRK